MVKIALPVSEGIPFETKGQLQRYLADQGLRRVFAAGTLFWNAGASPALIRQTGGTISP